MSNLNNSAVLERLESHVAEIRSGRNPKLQPGQPVHLTEACSVNDAVVQGDIIVTVVRAQAEKWKDGATLKTVKKLIPKGYVQIENITGPFLQLVPGQTEGARHCLESGDGITMYRPAEWLEENLDGPLLFCSKPNKILHPVHGPVFISGGMVVKIDYDRQWDLEQAKERRARD